jgi:hypothetical protein
MFGWLPRWHPLVWAFVIIMLILIWHDPVGWGQKVGNLIHYVPVIAQRIGTFFTSI